MTQRKPPGVSFETWIDRQIRDATERGEFDNLPGRGKPIADLDQPHDELWWIRQKMQRENVSYLPPTLALRKEAEDGRAAASRAGSAAEARRIVTAINDKIRAANRVPLSGPPLNLAPFDVEAVVHAWQASQPRDSSEGAPAPLAPSEPITDDQPAPDAPLGGDSRSPRRWLRRWSRSSGSPRTGVPRPDQD
jgi:hypothetical protein